MNETETRPTPALAGRKRKRFLLAGAALLAVAVACAVGWLLRGQWLLQEAIAEADQLDPGWRWQELEAWRETIPDAENALLLVLAAQRALPRGWPSSAVMDLFKVDPNVQLDPAKFRLLEKELQTGKRALDIARLLADRPKGRFTPRSAPVALFISCNEVANARNSCNLWRCEAIYRAERQEPGRSLAACRAALNAGRAIGDWPCVIAMLVRIACQSAALDAIERTLAQTEPPEAGLSTLQRLLEDEAAQPLLLYAARGERAMMDDLFEAFQSGRISGADVGTAFSVRTGPMDIHGYRLELYLRNKLRRAEVLRNNTRQVEIAKLPVEAQRAAIGQFCKEHSANQLGDVPLLGEGIESGQFKWAFIFLRSQARLRAMIALLAAERFRLARGRWPNCLDELCPDFLQAVPLDPSDGQPLKLRRLPDGLMIYAVGADGKDHGGNLRTPAPTAPGTDFGYRLWDVNRRRQPPPAFVGSPAPGQE